MERINFPFAWDDARASRIWCRRPPELEWGGTPTRPPHVPLQLVRAHWPTQHRQQLPRQTPTPPGQRLMKGRGRSSCCLLIPRASFSLCQPPYHPKLRPNETRGLVL
jgi:hypothetical protein